MILLKSQIKIKKEKKLIKKELIEETFKEVSENWGLKYEINN